MSVTVAVYACLSVAFLALGTAFAAFLQRRAVERSGWASRVRRGSRA